MIPVNNQHSFGVFIGKNYNVINSLKELKSFLNALFIVLDIKAFNELAKVKVEGIKQISNSSKDLEIVKLKEEIDSLKQSNNEQKQKIDRQRKDLGVLHTKLANMK